MIKPPPPITTSLYCLSRGLTKDMADRHTLAAIYIRGGVVGTSKGKEGDSQWNKIP